MWISHAVNMKSGHLTSACILLIVLMWETKFSVAVLSVVPGWQTDDHTIHATYWQWQKYSCCHWLLSRRTQLGRKEPQQRSFVCLSTYTTNIWQRFFFLENPYYHIMLASITARRLIASRTIVARVGFAAVRSFGSDSITVRFMFVQPS